MAWLDDNVQPYIVFLTSTRYISVTGCLAFYPARAETSARTLFGYRSEYELKLDRQDPFERAIRGRRGARKLVNQPNIHTSLDVGKSRIEKGWII